jgi:pimeloyl-ACP methyl ester carboxylesterase
LKIKALSALLHGIWLLAPGVVNRLVKKSFFIPRRDVLSVKETEFLSKGQSFTIQVRDKNIICWKWGDGPVVVLAHGWNGRGVQFKPMIKQFLKVGYSVVTYDAYGHGASDGEESNYFMFSETLRAILTHDRRWDIKGLVGHSLGAAAVINALAKEQRSISAVLFAPPMDLKKLLYHAFDSHGIPYPVYHKLIVELEQRLDYSIDLENPKKLLSQINSNILIIHDKLDRAVPHSESEYYASKHSNLELFTTEGFGHGKILRKPLAIQQAIDFIGKYSSAKRLNKELIF